MPRKRPNHPPLRPPQPHPLEYFARRLFDKDCDLPPVDTEPCRPVELVTGKESYKMLFVGNSLTYSGDVPRQIRELAKMYGISEEWIPLICAQYEQAALAFGAIAIDAAETALYAYTQYPDLALFKENDYHANDTGAYLTACTFAAKLFNIHVQDMNKENLYHGEDALRIGEAVWECVTG